MLEFTPDQFVCVMYYSTTGYSCPQHNQRSSFYSVSGVPVAWFDGYEDSLGGLPSGSMIDYYRPIVNDHLQDPSPLMLSLDMTITGSEGEVDGLIEVTEDVPAGDFLVYVVLYEAEAARTPNLARDFPVWQEPLTATTVGQTQSVSGTFTVDSSWNTEHLYAILFVQLNEGNKEILQAGRSGPGPIPPLAASIDCSPSFGTLPFQATFDLTLENRLEDQSRLVAARVGVELAGGQIYPNWRSGALVIGAGSSFSTTWVQNLPDNPALVGVTYFTLVAEDVTPAPYNQPPYAASGDTETAGCSVFALAP